MAEVTAIFVLFICFRVGRDLLSWREYHNIFPVCLRPIQGAKWKVAQSSCRLCNFFFVVRGRERPGGQRGSPGGVGEPGGGKYIYFPPGVPPSPPAGQRIRTEGQKGFCEQFVNKSILPRKRDPRGRDLCYDNSATVTARGRSPFQAVARMSHLPVRSVLLLRRGAHRAPAPSAPSNVGAFRTLLRQRATGWFRG